MKMVNMNSMSKHIASLYNKYYCRHRLTCIYFSIVAIEISYICQYGAIKYTCMFSVFLYFIFMIFSKYDLHFLLYLVD